MPNIEQYNSTAEMKGIQPSNLGVEAEEQAGRRVGAFYHQIGDETSRTVTTLGQQYDDHVTQQQVLQATSAMTKMHSAELDDWNAFEKNADPNDHTAVQAFRDKWDAQYQTIADHMSTDRGKEAISMQVASQRRSMYETTAAGASAMAGIAAEQNLNSTIDQASANAYRDPSKADDQMGAVRLAASAAASSPNLDAESAAKIQAHYLELGGRQIAMAKFQKMIRTNPEAADGEIDHDDMANQYLTAEERNSLHDQVREQVRTNNEDALHQAAAQKAKDTADFNVKLDQVYAATWKDDGHGGVIQTTPPNAAQILQDLSKTPGADPEKIKALGDAFSKATKDAIDGTDARTDPATYQWFASKIGTPHGFTTSQVDNGYAQGKLSKDDYTTLRAAARDDKSLDPKEASGQAYLNKSLENLKGTITRSNDLGNTDPTGDGRYAQMFRDAHVDYDRLHAAHPEMTGEQVVDWMMDPNKAGSFVTQIGNYQTNNKQGMAAVLAATRAGGGGGGLPDLPNKGLPPRTPGESVSDYLKRTGGQ